VRIPSFDRVTSLGTDRLDRLPQAACLRSFSLVGVISRGLLKFLDEGFDHVDRRREDEQRRL
jgi:hypothetical protein